MAACCSEIISDSELAIESNELDIS